MLLNDLTSYVKQFKPRYYKKGHILIYADDTPNYIYFVFSGKVKQYCISDDGIEVVVNTYRKNGLFPITNLVSSTENEYFYEATDDLLVSAIPITKISEYLLYNPRSLMEILKKSLDISEKITRKMSYAFASTAYYRIIYELLLESDEVAPTTDETRKLEIHEFELANQVGLSRETANRELKKLKNLGIIAVDHKNIIIKNLRLLRRELGDHI